MTHFQSFFSHCRQFQSSPWGLLHLWEPVGWSQSQGAEMSPRMRQAIPKKVVFLLQHIKDPSDLGVTMGNQGWWSGDTTKCN
jgi:hypothetical protein